MFLKHVALGAFAAGLFAYPALAEDKFAGVDLSPTKVGPESALQDISKYCGTNIFTIGLRLPVPMYGQCQRMRCSIVI